MSNIDLSDYIPVSERIQTFKERHPEGRLVSEVVDTGFPGFVAVKAYAYRTPDDPQPGTGLAWEPVPGPTPFTKNSELQNAETAAWGRALIGALIADASKGIASREEVQRHSEPPPASTADMAWRRLWEEAKVLKAWSDEERIAQIEAAMKYLKIEEVADQDKADSIFAHITNEYAKRPMETQEALPVD